MLIFKAIKHILLVNFLKLYFKISIVFSYIYNLEITVYNHLQSQLMKVKTTPTQEKIYTQDEAFAASLKYFKGDELAARVWINKYALKDSYDNIYEQSPQDMHVRIASEIARIEAKYPNPMSEEEIMGLIENFKYIVPQGSPMAGIGNKFQVASLSNCFVIGNNGNSDSYGSIMKIDQEQVQLMKRRGGVGHDLSHIRPKGSPVKNSALTSTGIVPFMERYSNSTQRSCTRWKTWCSNAISLYKSSRF